jgi:hypothetical protein
VTPVQALLAARKAAHGFGRWRRQAARALRRPLPDDIKAALREHGQRLVQLLAVDARPHWRTFDSHDCWSRCERGKHPLCNACGQELPRRWQFWPHLHPDCRLERLD